MKRILIFLLLLILSAAGFVLYRTFQGPDKEPYAINASPLLKADKVLVLKSERKMHLLHQGKIFRTYDVSLGGSPEGDKVQQGDNKTPEGTYVLDWRNSKSSCYKSIHISYPDKRDSEAAKKLNVSPGGDIMVHGLHPSITWMGSRHTQFDWTNGCVAVSNEEMDEIWESVKNGTTIEIRK